jgi:hypothetical protein
VLFTINFPVPAAGSPDHGVPHFLNIIGGDLDTGSMQVNVDGALTALTNVTGAGVGDGGITLTFVPVPWAVMTDGQVIVDFVTPSEPYVTVDYVLLDTEVQSLIPVPAAVWPGVMLIAALVLARSRRRAG